MVVLLLACSAKLRKQPPSEAWNRGVGVAAQENRAAERGEMPLFSAERDRLSLRASSPQLLPFSLPSKSRAAVSLRIPFPVFVLNIPEEFTNSLGIPPVPFVSV